MSAQRWRYEITAVEGFMADREHTKVGTVWVDDDLGPEHEWTFEKLGSFSYVTGRRLNESTGDPIADQARYEASAAKSGVGGGGAMSDLNAIRARERAATRGPWRTDCGHVISDHNGPDNEYALDADVFGSNHDADAEFIAHAREDVPALVARIEAALSWLDDFDEHGILDVNAFHDALRRALTIEREHE